MLRGASVLLVLKWLTRSYFCNDDQHIICFSFTTPFGLISFLLNPAVADPSSSTVWMSLLFWATAQWSLGLIQLIKTQFVFVLMTLERLTHTRASIIPASDEESVQSLYGFQTGLSSNNTAPNSVDILYSHTTTSNLTVYEKPVLERRVTCACMQESFVTVWWCRYDSRTSWELDVFSRKTTLQYSLCYIQML